MVDRNSLVQDIDMEAYVDYLGIEKKRMGSKTFIRCPGHLARTGKQDRKISNAVICGKGYYCHACGEFHSVIDMTEEVLGCDFKEAIKTMQNFLGRDYSVGKDALVKSNRCPISAEDLKLIGIGIGRGKARAYLNVTNEETQEKTGDGMFLKYESAYQSIDALFREDPEGFRFMVGSKAMEARMKFLRMKDMLQTDVLDPLISEIGSGIDDFKEGLLGAYDDYIKRTENILNILKIPRKVYQKERIAS